MEKILVRLLVAFLLVSSASAQNFVTWVTNKAALKTLQPVQTRLSVDVGEDVGGWAKWHWNSTSTASTNTVDTIQVTGITTGRWIRSSLTGVVDGYVESNGGVSTNLSLFGDAIIFDDGNELQDTVDYLMSATTTGNTPTENVLAPRPHTVATISSLVSDIDPLLVPNYARVTVLGYFSAGDGGGGDFRRVLASSGSTSLGTFFKSTYNTTYAWQRLISGPISARWFGAKGDGVTDDTQAIRAAVAYCKSLTYGGEVFFPSGKYVISDFIDCVAANSTTRINLRGEGVRNTIIESTNKAAPILVMSGSYFQWSGFRLQYDTEASLSEEDAVGILLVNVDNATLIGAHWASFRDIWINNTASGFRVQQGGSGTIGATAAAGATNIVAAGGAYTWNGFVIATVGAYITLTLDDASTHTTQIIARSGTTLTLRDALPSQATSGNTLTILSGQFFSNTLSTMTVEDASLYGVWLGGAGTGSVWNNLYIRNGTQQSTWGNTVAGLLVATHGQNVFNQLNLEAMCPSDAAIRFTFNSGTVINSLHTEGVKLTNDFGSLIRLAGGPIEVNGWEVRSLETSGAINAGLVRLANWSFGELNNWPGVATINGLTILGSKIDPDTTLVWAIADTDATNATVTINDLQLRPNHGFPLQTINHAMVVPSTYSQVLRKLGDYTPAGAVGQIFGHALNYSNDGRIGLLGTVSPQSVLFRDSRGALTTAAVGIYTGTNQSGTALLGTTQLSDITSTAATQREALATATTFAPSVVHLHTVTNQSITSIVGTGTNVTYQRIGNTTSTRGLVKWTFGSAHGLAVRDLLDVSGASAVTNINERQEVVIVESSTVAYTYLWTGYTSASNDTAHSETGITMTRFPTVDAFLFGGQQLENTGYKTLFIPASYFSAANSSPATATTRVNTTNNTVNEVWEFSASADQYVTCAFVMPDKWDGSSLKAKFVWRTSGTTTNAVVWSIAGTLARNVDQPDIALGTAQTLADESLTTAYLQQISAATGTIAPSGTYNSDAMLRLLVGRLATNGSDLQSATALLEGVWLQYRETATEPSVW